MLAETEPCTLGDVSPEEYKALRKQVGTQEEVAALLGVRRATLSDRERGAPDAKITKEAELAIRYLAEKAGKPRKPKI